MIRTIRLLTNHDTKRTIKIYINTENLNRFHIWLNFESLYHTYLQRTVFFYRKKSNKWMNWPFHLNIYILKTSNRIENDLHDFLINTFQFPDRECIIIGWVWMEISQKWNATCIYKNDWNRGGFISHQTKSVSSNLFYSQLLLFSVYQFMKFVVSAFFIITWLIFLSLPTLFIRRDGPVYNIVANDQIICSFLMPYRNIVFMYRDHHI